jgi:hypothetical protein
MEQEMTKQKSTLKNMKSKLRKCQFWKFPWETNFGGRENDEKLLIEVLK